MDRVKKRIRDRGYKRKYYKNNREIVNKANQKYITDNPEKRLFWKAKYSAKRRGLECDITEKDIVIPKVCPLLDIEITNELGNGGSISNPSVDRIDNSKGYIKGNVWIISKLANRMKNSATKEQLLTFAKNINKMYGGT